jgi:hypothetical protein
MGLLVHIVAQQLILGCLIGQNATRRLVEAGGLSNIVVMAGIFLAGALAMARALAIGPALFRKAGLAAALLLAAALISPKVSATMPQWPAMTIIGYGDRYYVLPMLIFVSALLILTTDHLFPARLAGIAGLCGFCLVAVPQDWNYPAVSPAIHQSFTDTAGRFEAAAPGTVMSFPIRPGDDNRMWLVKQ